MTDGITRNLPYLAENLINLDIILVHLVKHGIISEKERDLNLRPSLTSPQQKTKLLILLTLLDWNENRYLYLDIFKKTDNQVCVDKIEEAEQGSSQSVIGDKGKIVPNTRTSSQNIGKKRRDNNPYVS
ncbi:hypothetical protein, partial [Rahnella variigena]|uniref:hypothetical protein n=1 Tax=Rahnella variigena TaxID=574964 RepID=UPI00132FE080